MSTLKPVDRMLLEELLEMKGGYVLSFSDASFSSFVRASTGENIDAEPYLMNGGSKARRLRTFWDVASNAQVAKLLDDLLTWMIDSKKVDAASTEAGRVRGMIRHLGGTSSPLPLVIPERTDAASSSTFVSYSSTKKVAGAAVKRILERHGFPCFLAHQDVKVSQAWKERILQELRRADIFVAVLSKEFKESNWCGQELGFIASRTDVLIVPLTVDGTTPYGFIEHLQGTAVTPKNIDAVLEDVLFRERPRHMIPVQIARVRATADFRAAEAQFSLLMPYMDALTAGEATALAEATAQNGQVWNAAKCRTEYIPNFVRLKGPSISRGAAKALQAVLPDLKRKLPQAEDRW